MLLVLPYVCSADHGFVSEIRGFRTSFLFFEGMVLHHTSSVLFMSTLTIVIDCPGDKG